MRAVLDANVLVSALLSRRGAPARLLERWLDGAFELVVGPMLLEEVRRTLASPKLAPYVDDAEAVRFVALLAEGAETFGDRDDEPSVRAGDPADDYLLVLAAAADARLVSGDRHLLALADRVPVMSPREFLSLLDA